MITDQHSVNPRCHRSPFGAQYTADSAADGAGVHPAIDVLQLVVELVTSSAPPRCGGLTYNLLPGLRQTAAVITPHGAAHIRTELDIGSYVLQRFHLVSLRLFMC